MLEGKYTVVVHHTRSYISCSSIAVFFCQGKKKHIFESFGAQNSVIERIAYTGVGGGIHGTELYMPLLVCSDIFFLLLGRS